MEVAIQANNTTDRNPNVSVVIPAYNEESRITTVLTKYCEYFPNEEIIIVCNGCVDRTPEIAEQMSHTYSQLKVLVFEEKIGKGGAVIEGFKVAHGSKIGFVDADESVEPEDLAKMFDVLSTVDGVLASRRLKDSVILVKQPWIRRAGSKFFNIIIRFIFWFNFKDTQCGAKVFSQRAIRDVLNSLNTTGFEFDVELIWKVKKAGYKIIEYPIVWKHSEGSTFNVNNAPKMVFSLLMVRLRG